MALVALPYGVRSRARDEQASGAIRHALTNEPFLRFLFATLRITWIECQIHTTFPLYMQDSGNSSQAYGFLISLNGLLIVLFELAITAWTQRLRRSR